MDEIKYKIDDKKARERIIKSLKWIIVNLGDPDKNTFEYATKIYLEATILYLNTLE